MAFGTKFGFRARLEKSKQKIKKKLNEFVEDANEEVNKLYQSVFGSSSKFTDWKGRGIKSQFSRQLKKDFNPGALNTVRLKNLYAKAWKNKYDAIRAAYKSADPGYTEREWYKWKKRGKRKYRTPHYPARKIYYTTWGLASGYLRDSIETAFKRQGEEVTYGNLFLQAGFEVDWSQYPQSKGKAHYEHFIDHLIQLGVVSSEADFFDFMNNDWRKIANVMSDIVRDNFVENVDEVVEQIRKEV